MIIRAKMLIVPVALLCAAPFALAQPMADKAAAPAAAPAPAPVAAGNPGAGHEKAQFIATYDSNGDSVVSKAEFAAARATDYTRTDADKKNDVSEDEYVGDYAVRLDKELAEKRAAQIKQAHVRFGVLDKDKNAKITKSEYDASGDTIFGALDSNKDGSVDEKDKAESY